MKYFCLVLIFVFVMLLASPAFAVQTSTEGCTTGSGGQIECTIPNPIGQTSVEGVISIVIKSAMGIIGALTLLMFVWGGFTWLTSAGKPEKVKEGTQTMVWAAIGVILVFASYILLSTFLDYLTGKT